MGGIASGGAGGGGGLSTSSSSASGDAEGLSGSGNKIFNFGGNPNVGQSTAAISDTLNNPFVIIGVVGVVWLMMRRRKR